MYIYLVHPSIYLCISGANSSMSETDCDSQCQPSENESNCAEKNESVERRKVNEDKEREKRSDLKLPLSENLNKGEN